MATKAKTKRTKSATTDITVEGRTPRMRFVEKPLKVEGNPFVAVRVPREVHKAFMAHCKKAKTPAADVIRAYLSKLTGVPLVAAEGEE